MQWLALFVILSSANFGLKVNVLGTSVTKRATVAKSLASLSFGHMRLVHWGNSTLKVTFIPQLGLVSTVVTLTPS